MNVIQERLGRLRELMAEKGMDAYLVVTADFHESEYVPLVTPSYDLYVVQS